MDYATQWKVLKEQELEAQKQRRELEDKMRFENYTHPNLKVKPSITKYFELTNDQYVELHAKGFFEVEYKPNWKTIKENEELLSLVQYKEGRPTFTWEEKNV